MNEPLGILGTPNIGFLALVVIGGLAGWIAGMIAGARHRLFTNVLIGVAGSWLGSQIADLAGLAVEGSLSHFLGALVGSILIIAIWRRLSPEASRPAIPPDRYPTLRAPR